MNHLNLVVENHALALVRVQERIAQLACIKMNSFGIYDDKNPAQNQTYCNHAVYLTIKALDKNYKDFLIEYDEPTYWRDEYANDDIWKKYKNQYQGPNKYKASNFWCDVLEYKSNDTTSHIRKVNEFEAQELANHGYVVIASWKNTIDKTSPHFVTVCPGNKKVKKEEIIVLHVGGSSDRRLLKMAFPDPKYTTVEFYYNSNQEFIEDYENIKNSNYNIVNLEKRYK